MKYVYIIQSIKSPEKYYTGITDNIKSRITDHNQGKCTHTAKFKPWKLIAYTAFTNNQKARDFEVYLKSGSGRAFSKKHFRNS